MKQFHKYYMSAPTKREFNDRLEEFIPRLPSNATIESVSYNTDVKVMDGDPNTSASVLIIYSTPLEE